MPPYNSRNNYAKGIYDEPPIMEGKKRKKGPKSNNYKDECSSTGGYANCNNLLGNKAKSPAEVDPIALKNALAQIQKAHDEHHKKYEAARKQWSIAKQKEYQRKSYYEKRKSYNKWTELNNPFYAFKGLRKAYNFIKQVPIEFGQEAVKEVKEAWNWFKKIIGIHDKVAGDPENVVKRAKGHPEGLSDTISDFFSGDRPAEHNFPIMDRHHTHPKDRSNEELAFDAEMLLEAKKSPGKRNETMELNGVVWILNHDRSGTDFAVYETSDDSPDKGGMYIARKGTNANLTVSNDLFTDSDILMANEENSPEFKRGVERIFEMVSYNLTKYKENGYINGTGYSVGDAIWKAALAHPEIRNGMNTYNGIYGGKQLDAVKAVWRESDHIGELREIPDGESYWINTTKNPSSDFLSWNIEDDTGGSQMNMRDTGGGIIGGHMNLERLADPDNWEQPLEELKQWYSDKYGDIRPDQIVRYKDHWSNTGELDWDAILKGVAEDEEKKKKKLDRKLRYMLGADQYINPYITYDRLLTQEEYEQELDPSTEREFIEKEISGEII